MWLCSVRVVAALAASDSNLHC